jgi:4,5-DOPA dioxygenase extradiol
MNRKSFLKNISVLPLTFAAMNLNDFDKLTHDLEGTEKMPVLFVGHGSPMNVITDNPYRQKWAELGKSLPTPKAILCISAHWLTRGTYVTMTDKPKTIHDFGGFPQALYQQQYPAAGAKDMAKMTIENIKGVTVHEDYEWGLDHGTWCILKPMFPDAQIPVFQMSIDYTQPPQYHYDLAKELAFLRQKGVLIIGSGNVVHNFVGFQTGGGYYDWAVTFDNFIKENIEKHDDKPLVEYEKLGRLAHLAHPSNDHYLPFLYTLALRGKGESHLFFNESIDYGTMSMRSVIFNG